MANYSTKSKETILDILKQALLNSKNDDSDWLFLCNQINFVVDESYEGSKKVLKLVMNYFKRCKPTDANKYKAFYEHPEFRSGSSICNAWWHTNDEAKEQRILFLEQIINNLESEINGSSNP